MRHDSEHLGSLVERNSFDVIVDIESSFFYPNKRAFFCGVSRALKEDGAFLYGALMFSFQQRMIESWLSSYFDIEKKQDISENAIQALKHDSEDLGNLID